MSEPERGEREREREALLFSERRARETAETLAAANLALAQSLDLRTILETLLDYLARLVPYDSASVLLLEGTSTLVLRALRGFKKFTDPAQTLRISFDARTNDHVRKILEERRPIVINDTLADPDWEQRPGTEHVRSWLAVPLVVRGKAIGSYSVDKAEPGFFQPEHVRLAEALAPPAATAIEIARVVAESRESSEFTRQVIASAEEGIIVYDRDLRHRLWNRFMEDLTGLGTLAVLGKTATELFPEPAAKGNEDLARRALAGDIVTSPDIETTTPTGRMVWSSARFSPLRDAGGAITGVIAVIRDLTERKKAEAMREAQNRILERIAMNAPLEETLTTLARFVETALPGALCTVLLLEEDGVHVRHGAAPSLPAAFVEAIDGLPIGPTAGSCGTAMFLGEDVVASDIATDPLWAEYRDLAAQAGLRACWSTLIRSHDGRVLGSFAIYYREVRDPEPSERRVVDVATPLAGIAIERARADQALHRSAKRYRAVVDQANDAIIISGPGGAILEANLRAHQMLGRSEGELVGASFGDLVVPEQREDASQNRALLPHGATNVVNRELMRPDQSRVPVEISSAAVLMGGQPLLIRIMRDVTERKRAEETLQRSAQRLKSVVDGALDAVISMDAQGRVISWNPRAEAIFGFAPEEALGQLVADLIIPHRLREGHRMGLERFLATGEQTVIGRRELTALRRDGAEFPIELSLVAIEEDGGTSFTGFIADISERKEAARRLSESDERFRQMAENIRDVFWLTDPSKKEVFYVSPAYEEIWGLSSQGLLDSPNQWVEAVHPDDRGRILEASLTKQATGDYDEEYRVVRPDGSIRWIWDRAFPVLDKDGKVFRIAGIAEDITARKRAAEELRESDRRFRATLANVDLVSLMLDTEARITYGNDYLLRLTGWSNEEVLGRSWLEMFIPPPDRMDLEGTFAALLADVPAAWHHENEILTRSGARRLIRWNNSVLRSGSGEVIGTASIGQDVTDERHLEQQLRQSQKMEAVGRLAGGVAHDFNNILNVITGYSEMILRKTPEVSPDRRRIKEILRAADRAAGLTRQLLAFSRKQVLQPKVLEPSALVADMQKMLERLIGEDVDLTVKMEARGRVKADPGQLEQVVMNLVVNARDAMPKGGSLTIATADIELDEEYVQRREDLHPGRYVVLVVSDTGHGMDEATQARVYEPFFTTKPEGKGTGLGLATVYGIVRQSGGHISMYSEVGQGTVFRVYLPRVEEAASKERPRKEPARRQATETVLVVEDEPAARELIGEILRTEGYAVLMAGNGLEAVETAALPGMRIQCLLTDVVLPKLSGRAAAEQIQVLQPGVKVLYMSGYTEEAISHHGVLEPGIVLLQKPFTPDELVQRVGEVLDEPSV